MGIDAVMSECLGNWIEFVQEFIASNPERAGTVFEERGNQHPAQTVGSPWLVLEHLELVAVIPVQSIL
jgi:hypothetical protein